MHAPAPTRPTAVPRPVAANFHDIRPPPPAAAPGAHVRELLRPEFVFDIRAVRLDHLLAAAGVAGLAQEPRTLVPLGIIGDKPSEVCVPGRRWWG